MKAFQPQQHRHQPSGPAMPPSMMGPGLGGLGNSDRLEMMGADRDSDRAQRLGPFGGSALDAALELGFGTSLTGLEAGFGERAANQDINARAHTRGRRMSFACDMSTAMGDLDAMEVAAHETAHALAGGGRGCTPVDQPGDPGERGADVAGKAFRRWAAGGFQGAAPNLQPAHGGQAAIHRYSTDASVITGSPYLQRGSTGTLVETLQYLLNSLSGAGLAVDGDFGPATHRAVRAYQAANRLSADGIVGPQTAGALNNGVTAPSTDTSTDTASEGAQQDVGSTTAVLDGSTTLRRGMSGALVTALQELLNAKGAGLVTDGDFGVLTESAVRSFQSANGLEVDGIVGSQTASALNSGESSDVGAGSSTEGGGAFAGVEGYADLRDAVIAAAESHLGAPYYWGADGPSMFDCSGFVLYVLRQDTGLVDWGDDTAHGIRNRLPATTKPEKGDLAFLWSGGSIQHVEIMMGSGTQTIAAGGAGAGSSTRGDNPNAKVQYDDLNSDSRAVTFGSIAGLIEKKLGA